MANSGKLILIKLSCERERDLERGGGEGEEEVIIIM